MCLTSRRGLRAGGLLFDMAEASANHRAKFGIGCYTGSVVSTALTVTGGQRIDLPGVMK